MAGNKVGVVALERRPAEADRRLRHVEIDPLDRAQARERRVGNGLEIALGRQIGERLVDQRRRAFFVDRADDRDQQLIARNPALRSLDEVAPFDPRERFEGPAGRLAVRVTRKRLFLPVAVGEGPGIIGVVAQARVHMLAHAFERLLVEPRRLTARRNSSAARSRFLVSVRMRPLQ